jgi:hypothetical protein
MIVDSCWIAGARVRGRVGGAHSRRGSRDLPAAGVGASRTLGRAGLSSSVFVLPSGIGIDSARSPLPQVSCCWPDSSRPDPCGGRCCPTRDSAAVAFGAPLYVGCGLIQACLKRCSGVRSRTLNAVTCPCPRGDIRAGVHVLNLTALPHFTRRSGRVCSAVTTDLHTGRWHRQCVPIKIFLRVEYSVYGGRSFVI